MSKASVIDLQWKILRDRRLSDGAKILGVMLCSYVYTNRELEVDEYFPCPWTLAGKQCHPPISKNETYARLKELSTVGHIARRNEQMPRKSYCKLLPPDPKPEPKKPIHRR